MRGLIIAFCVFFAYIANSMKAQKNDYIDALVAFFTVEFTKCHKRTGITTCKYSIYIHV